MYGDLKMTFIQKCLTQYMEEVIDTMRVVMKRRGVEVTGDAYNSLAHKERQAGAGASADLIFKEYLRMVDMGVGRGYKLGGLKAMRVALAAQRKEGNVLVKKSRKPKKIYSPIAYGKLTWLQNRLLYGYTEETIAMLKKELEGGD